MTSTSSGSGPYRYTYSWAPAQPETGRLTTSPTELLHIVVAFLVLTFDFVLILYVGGLFTGFGFSAFGSVPAAVVLTAAGLAFTAFVCHELAHKVSAQRHGYWAEFRWYPMGLVFSVFTAYLGFLFAAPGATIVSGMGDPRQWGRTSLAGPLVNLAFAGVFYASAVTAWILGSPLFFWLLLLAYFNTFFAAFNLVPYGPLDGAKVLRWNSVAWALSFGAAAVFAAVCYLGTFYLHRPIF